MFKNKVLMITGGTGSFGKAVLNKFIETDFSEIRIFSRDEKKKEDLRITLDKELICRNLINQKYIHENENFKKERFVILEFKFNDKNYNLVRNLSSQIPNRFTKFSKYEYSLLN